MKRISELVADIRKKYPNDDFFSDFERSCAIARKHLRSYDEALMVLDNESWQILKDKALRHYLDERRGQRKQGFFNQLNESLAYRYLVRKGFRHVRFIKEGKNQSPDISFGTSNMSGYCEVRTLGISVNEIGRRSSHSVYDLSEYRDLSPGFLGKLKCDFDQALCQIRSFGDKGLVFIVIRFDDIALDHYQRYREQLAKYCQDQRFDNLFLKIGERGNKRISIRSLAGGRVKSLPCSS
jgi:hypothetical protein